MTQLLRIGNAGGYWGDDPTALRRQVEGPLALDVISIDYLAEVTMSILHKQRLKDPTQGYARDFLTQLEPVLEAVLARRIRIITNAGGANPEGCARALAELGRAKGFDLRIAVVDGDDLLDRLGDLNEPLRNMETGESFDPHRSRALAANAYFGALPIVEALTHDPHIVVCGRVTDTAITLAPMIHAFDWRPDDWDRLAAGIVAGHLVECGTQATGGNFTDWRKVHTFLDLGFPILEVEPDGAFTLTRHPGSGGLVSLQTVREQFLYEMGDPHSYLTPDVIADFTTIHLEQTGPDRVRITGVQGRPPTDLLKVSLAYPDGCKASGAVIISGPDARPKAEVFARLFWKRLGQELSRVGLPLPEVRSTEFVGHDATHHGLTPPHAPAEILLRLGARDPRKAPLEVFRKLLPALILSGPPGVAVTGGAPSLTEVVAYWPALVDQEAAPARVRAFQARDGELLLLQDSGPLPWPHTQGQSGSIPLTDDPHTFDGGAAPLLQVPLMAIAHARSGDKGDTANIGLIGRSPQCYAWLRDHVDADRVKAWFEGICQGTVVRHRVPNLWALNFLLEASLGGGGTRSLLLDAQGKTLSQALLRCEVEIPASLLDTIDEDHRPCAGELLP